MQYVEKMFVTQSTYDHLCVELARQVRRSGQTFDWIVCLSRGGLYVGNLLSRLLELPLGVMAVQSKPVNGVAPAGQQTEPAFSSVIAATRPVQGRVLLVDDLIETGASMQVAWNCLKQIEAIDSISTGVLYLKSEALVADFYAVKLQLPFPWIVQPFEIFEL
jgi:hypothetical protein